MDTPAPSYEKSLAEKWDPKVHPPHFWPLEKFLGRKFRKFLSEKKVVVDPLSYLLRYPRGHADVWAPSYARQQVPNSKGFGPKFRQKWCFLTIFFSERKVVVYHLNYLRSYFSGHGDVWEQSCDRQQVKKLEGFDHEIAKSWVFCDFFWTPKTCLKHLN